MVRRRGPAAPAARLAGGASQGDRAHRPAASGGVPARMAGYRPPPGRRRRHRPAAGGAGGAPGACAARRDMGARRAAAAHRGLLAVLAGQPVRERRGRVGRRRCAGALRTRGPVLPRGRRRDWAAGGRAGTWRRSSTERSRASAAAGAPGPGAMLLHRPARRARRPIRGAARGVVGPRVGGRGDQRRVGAAARSIREGDYGRHGPGCCCRSSRQGRLREGRWLAVRASPHAGGAAHGRTQSRSRAAGR